MSNYQFKHKGESPDTEGINPSARYVECAGTLAPAIQIQPARASSVGAAAACSIAMTSITSPR